MNDFEGLGGVLAAVILIVIGLIFDFIHGLF